MHYFCILAIEIILIFKRRKQMLGEEIMQTTTLHCSTGSKICILMDESTSPLAGRFSWRLETFLVILPPFVDLQPKVCAV